MSNDKKTTAFLISCIILILLCISGLRYLTIRTNPIYYTTMESAISNIIGPESDYVMVSDHIFRVYDLNGTDRGLFVAECDYTNLDSFLRFLIDAPNDHYCHMKKYGEAR